MRRGPFFGPDGEVVTFLVCTVGERPNVLIGPLLSDEEIEMELREARCENQHFRSVHAFAGAPIRLPVAAWSEPGDRQQWALEWTRRFATRTITDTGSHRWAIA